MKTNLTFFFFIVFLFSIFNTNTGYCQSKIPICDSLKYKKILRENDSLRKVIATLKSDKQQPSKPANNIAIYNGKISIIQFESGFDPYHNSDNLWLPCLTIKFKNISNQDIKESIKITVVFIDNDNNEQIASVLHYLTAYDLIFSKGTTKQLSFTSKTGWYLISSERNVIAKVYIQDKLFKTVKINNTEFNGVINSY